MAESMCSSPVLMGSLKGLFLLQRRQRAVDLKFLHLNLSALAMRPSIPSRQFWNSSLPERYVPKKSGSEKVAGREAGGRFSEPRRSQPYDSESGQSHPNRAWREGRERNTESASQRRSLRSADLTSKRGSRLVIGREIVQVKDFEPRKLRGIKPQQLLADEELQSEDIFAPNAAPDTFNFPPDERKGCVESHDAKVAAKDYCISLLALAPQPEAKLRMKMSKKKFSSGVMDAVIGDLQRCGLQSDMEYAEVFTRSRWNGNAWGPKRIQCELLRRGLSKEIVEAGLNHVFQGNEGVDVADDEEEVGAGRWGMNQKAGEQLISQARQRWNQASKLDINTRKRRFASWLQRRGFSWDTTSDLLKMLQREDREELE